MVYLFYTLLNSVCLSMKQSGMPKTHTSYTLKVEKSEFHTFRANHSINFEHRDNFYSQTNNNKRFFPN